MKLLNKPGRNGGLIVCAVLAGCTSMPVDGSTRDAPIAVNGPAADYPVVIGDPFDIEGVAYTPIDTMNYDAVGYVTGDAPENGGVTAAHKTLPLPSYIEVTSLDSGRTILARVERRGPMTNDRVLGLSAGALAQLGVAEGAAIRLRRVNPPEEHRAELRAGGEAPLRMETPPGLLEVLKRRLPDTGAVSLKDPRQEQVSGREPDTSTLAAIDAMAKDQPNVETAKTGPQSTTPLVTETDDHVPDIQDPPVIKPETDAVVATEIKAEPKPDMQPEAKPLPATGRYTIQIGAFSVRDNASRLAKKTGGHVVNSGQYALVRTGPYATRGQAEAALAKLASEGYSGARILTQD